jgi:hypothetical protein
MRGGGARTFCVRPAVTPSNRAYCAAPVQVLHPAVRDPNRGSASSGWAAPFVVRFYMHLLHNFPAPIGRVPCLSYVILPKLCSQWQWVSIGRK